MEYARELELMRQREREHEREQQGRKAALSAESMVLLEEIKSTDLADSKIVNDQQALKLIGGNEYLGGLFQDHLGEWGKPISQIARESETERQSRMVMSAIESARAGESTAITPTTVRYAGTSNELVLPDVPRYRVEGHGALRALEAGTSKIFDSYENCHKGLTELVEDMDRKWPAFKATLTQIVAHPEHRLTHFKGDRESAFQVSAYVLHHPLTLLWKGLRDALVNIKQTMAALQETEVFETDFKDMFYHFPVHPEDRPYLGVRKPFGSGYVRFARLPMGAATSPYHCSRLTYVWQDELHRQEPFAGRWAANLPGDAAYDSSRPLLARYKSDGMPAADDFLYVDDALGIAPSRAAAVAALRTLVVHGGSFGFVMKYSKIRDPAQSQRSFNGFDIETRPSCGGPMIRLREETRDAALSLVDALLGDRTSMQRDGISRRRLAQIVGKLQSLCPAVPHGTTFLRRLYDSVHCLHLSPEERPGTDYECAVWLDDEHWKDVRWWATALREHAGFRLLTNRDVHTRIHFTDGSGTGTGGCSHDFRGALPEVSFFSGLWSKAAASMTSNWKELRSILIALRRERTRAAQSGVESPLRQCRIYHATDNMVSESILARGTSTAPALQQLMREIAYELMVQQCALIPVHVAGKRLIAQGTDGLSRGQTAVGTMSGEVADVGVYNPLGGGIPDVPPSLRAWCRARYGEQPHLRYPDQWTADHVVGRDTLFYPHPLLARDALQAFRRHRMLDPAATAATFLLPRRLHSQWQRQLRGFQITVIKAGEGGHWPASEFEALIVARAEPWAPALPPPPPQARTQGRRARGTFRRAPTARDGRARRTHRR
jgi:hypothetical protein